jgi:hypothetical protein
MRGTMSPTDACQDGLLSAVPLSIRKVKASSVHGVIQPFQVTTVSSAETTSMKTWATSITLRRLKLSAMAPATSANSMIGKVAEAWTSAT